MPRTVTNHRSCLLDAAQALTLERGFSATRIDEVCAAAGVTKGSFYHHFESKDALAKALIDHYFDGVAAALSGGRWADVNPASTRALAFVDHAIAGVKGGLLKHGCLLGSFALDLSQTHPDLRAEVDDRFGRLAEVLRPSLNEALSGKTGIAGSAMTATSLARQFVAVLQGGIVLAKAHDDPKRLSEALRCYRRMLEVVLAEVG